MDPLFWMVNGTIRCFEPFNSIVIEFQHCKLKRFVVPLKINIKKIKRVESIPWNSEKDVFNLGLRASKIHAPASDIYQIWSLQEIQIQWKKTCLLRTLVIHCAVKYRNRKIISTVILEIKKKREGIFKCIKRKIFMQCIYNLYFDLLNTRNLFSSCV